MSIERKNKKEIEIQNGGGKEEKENLIDWDFALHELALTQGKLILSSSNVRFPLSLSRSIISEVIIFILG